MLPKKDLEAVHIQDLKALLKNWGLLADFEAVKILGITVIDHLIVTKNGYVSLKEINAI